MPEGVEVTVMASQMNQILAGKRLTRLAIISGPYMHNPKSHYMNFRRAVKELNSNAVEHEIIINYVRNKGKYIFAELGLIDSKSRAQVGVTYLLNHVGMAGHWRMDSGDHTIVMIVYREPNSIENQRFYYDDYRHFGHFFLLDADGAKEKLAELGPDILTRGFTLPQYLQILSQHRLRNRRIGELLMDQTVFSGMGNYLRADILHDAKLSPYREVITLNSTDRQRLYRSIVKVSRASFRLGGTTIATYRDVHAHPGRYDPVIYGKSTSPAKNPVVQDTLGGRTMHWVPLEQT